MARINVLAICFWGWLHLLNVLCHFLHQRSFGVAFPVIDDDAVGGYKRVARDSSYLYSGNLLYLIELVERLERSERIDIKTFDLVAYLHKHRVVELEH